MTTATLHRSPAGTPEPLRDPPPVGDPSRPGPPRAVDPRGLDALAGEGNALTAPTASTARPRPRADRDAVLTLCRVCDRFTANLTIHAMTKGACRPRSEISRPPT